MEITMRGLWTMIHGMGFGALYLLASSGALMELYRLTFSPARFESTPGQERFHFMWDELVKGAIGAVVLVDTGRLADCFPAVDYFEQRSVPFVVAVNCFNGAVLHPLDSVRDALAISAEVPMFHTDARDRGATRDALLTLVQHALVRSKG